MFSAVQCGAVQCSAVQCSAVQCSAVQCSAVQCNNIEPYLACPKCVKDEMFSNERSWSNLKLFTFILPKLSYFVLFQFKIGIAQVSCAQRIFLIEVGQYILRLKGFLED